MESYWDRSGVIEVLRSDAVLNQLIEDFYYSHDDQYCRQRGKHRSSANAYREDVFCLHCCSACVNKGCWLIYLPVSNRVVLIKLINHVDLKDISSRRKETTKVYWRSNSIMHSSSMSYETWLVSLMHGYLTWSNLNAISDEIDPKESFSLKKARSGFAGCYLFSNIHHRFFNHSVLTTQRSESLRWKDQTVRVWATNISPKFWTS